MKLTTTKLALVVVATFGLAMGAQAFTININYTTEFSGTQNYLNGTGMGTLSNSVESLPQGSHKIRPSWAVHYTNSRVYFDVDANGDIQNVQPSTVASGEGTNTLTIDPLLISVSSSGLVSPGHGIFGGAGCGGYSQATPYVLLPNLIGTGDHKGYYNAEVVGQYSVFRFRLDNNGCVYDVEEACGRNNCGNNNLAHPANQPGTISTDANGLITKTLDSGGTFSIQGCTPSEVCENNAADAATTLAACEADAAADATALAACVADAAADAAALAVCQAALAASEAAAAADATALAACQAALAASEANCLTCAELEVIVLDTVCTVLQLAPATSKAEFDTEVEAIAAGILAGAVICAPDDAASCLATILGNL
jgi:hypothetical protein